MDYGTMGKTYARATFTNGVDRTLATAGHLPPDQVRRVVADGVVDTGAAMVVLPQAMADQLGLPTNSEVNVRYADGRVTQRRVVEQLDVEILGRRSTFRAIVEPNRTEPLIGVIVLEDLDLLMDPRNLRLVLRDPAGEVYEVE